MTPVASKFCGASDFSAVRNKLVEYAGAILLWMNVIQLPLAQLGSNLRSYLAIGAAELVPARAVAVTGFASQFYLAQAFQDGDATVAVQLDFIRIPLINLADWWLRAEQLETFVFLGRWNRIRCRVESVHRGDAAGWEHKITRASIDVRPEQ
jgi:hypothetical protein